MRRILHITGLVMVIAGLVVTASSAMVRVVAPAMHESAGLVFDGLVPGVILFSTGVLTMIFSRRS
jgi:hypothetical protein